MLAEAAASWQQDRFSPLRSTGMQSSTSRPQFQGWQVVGTHDEDDHSLTETVAHRPVANYEIARLRAQAGDFTRPPASLLQHSARQLLHRHHTRSFHPDTAKTSLGDNSAASPGLNKSSERAHETSPMTTHETLAASSHFALSEWELL
ncbi:hypothetical protein WJX77_005808 [Trebouxia sp. C0004]